MKYYYPKNLSQINFINHYFLILMSKFQALKSLFIFKNSYLIFTLLTILFDFIFNLIMIRSHLIYFIFILIHFSLFIFIQTKFKFYFYNFYYHYINFHLFSQYLWFFFIMLLFLNFKFLFSLLIIILIISNQIIII